MTDLGPPIGGCLHPAAGPLVLASASPRRLELLGRLGLTPEVVPADVDESGRDGEPPERYVERVARDKALAVARLRPGALVLAADTAVVLDGRTLGKPADRDEALVMLTWLSGREHEVLTAVAAVASDGTLSEAIARARVTMALLGRAELEWYVDTGEPDDKAGAYAVQGVGAVLVERVDGDPTAVIGLPLRLSLSLLSHAGLVWPLPGSGSQVPEPTPDAGGGR